LSAADGSEAERQLTVMFRSYLLAAERQGSGPSSMQIEGRK